MKPTFTIKEITQLVNNFENLNDQAIETLSKQLSNRQPYMTGIIEASYEIFEDEEEYMEDLDYYFLLIDYLFTKVYGEMDMIMADFIEEKDAEHIDFIDKIAENEDFDEILFNKFESHPRKNLIMFFYDDLFDDDIDFDDASLEFTTQLMLMIYFIIDIYHHSTTHTNEA